MEIWGGHHPVAFRSSHLAMGPQGHVTGTNAVGQGTSRAQNHDLMAVLTHKPLQKHEKLKKSLWESPAISFSRKF